MMEKTNMSYRVKLEVFEGPFDLLFHLIEKNEVDIYDIPIAEITAQYLEYIEEIKYFDVEVASEFLVMAATLLQIKSKMLLPKQNEEEEEIDPRQQLVDRLIEYRKYKSITGELKKRADEYQKRIYKEPEPQIEYVDCEPVFINVDIIDLCRAYSRIMEKYKNLYNDNTDLMKSVQREEISLADKIRLIKNRLSGKKEISFDDLFNEYTTRADVVITFLAMLELIRIRKIIVMQKKIYGEIIIKKMDA